MRSSPGFIALAFALVAPGEALAFDVPPSSTVRLRGRLESAVVVERDAAPFDWNFTSRSAADFTRLMLDLRAGNERSGALYLKGAGTWRFAEEGAERPPFEFAQGDYTFTRKSERGQFRFVGFADERLFFTGEMIGASLDDDRMERFRHRWGARADGSAGESWRWAVVGAGLRDDAGSTRTVAHASTGWMAKAAQVLVSYLHDTPADGDSPSHVVARGDVSAFYRGATAIVAYAQSGFGEGVFLPNDPTPAAGATFAEVRLPGLELPSWGHLTVAGRYRKIGDEFTNDLADVRPGEAGYDIGAYVSHDRYALDARVVYENFQRWTYIDRQDERLSIGLRAFARDNSEWFLRAVLGRHRSETGDNLDERWVHAAWRRALRRFEGGIHAMAGDIHDERFATRFGVDTRVNVNSGLSFYGRALSLGDGVGSGLLFVRLEFRPLDHVFAFASFGRAHVGDDPYMLEDRDIGSASISDDVYTIGVRGDF